jgi:5-methylcytosine-specific restriction endonuclease McrA
MSGAWSKGSTRAWRNVRARVLTRDRQRCQLRIAGVCVTTSDPMHVHHIHGRDSGCPGCKADRHDHLQAACAPCNLSVGDPSRAADPPAIPITRW